MKGHAFPVYAAQRGAGLGGILTGLAKVAVPMVLPLLKSVGKSLLLGGARALDGGTSTVAGRRKRKRNGGRGRVAVRKRAGRSKQDIFS